MKQSLTHIQQDLIKLIKEGPFDKEFIFKFLTIYETPNCYTTCISESVSDRERDNWMRTNRAHVELYRDEKGYVEYDDRKC